MRIPGRSASDRGFTLIELMIVVAIIAILAALAIPNYLTFQCRAKQVEAKAGLGGLFSSEKAFLAEHNTFGTDLVYVNWEPEGAPLYLYGFGLSFPPAPSDLPGYDGNRNTTIDSQVVGVPARYSTAKMSDLNRGSLVLPFTACNGAGFILGASGDINPDVGVGLDQWTMDDKRSLSNVANDCTRF